jgi:hypothetical protein
MHIAGGELLQLFRHSVSLIDCVDHVVTIPAAVLQVNAVCAQNERPAEAGPSRRTFSELDGVGAELPVEQRGVGVDAAIHTA